MNGMNGMNARGGRRGTGHLPLLPIFTRLPLLPLPLLPLWSCELTEITVPIGEPRVIVQAVLSRTADRQFVIVERSVTGAENPTFGQFGGIPPFGPARPITGALVVLEYGEATACGPAADTLPPRLGSPGVYEGTGLCTPAPGDVVGLRVVTPDGAVVTGRTTIPGADEVVVEAGGDTARPAPADFTLDRLRDTLDLGARARFARAMQLEIRQSGAAGDAFGFGDDLVWYWVADSLGMTIPGDILNFLEDDAEALLRAGILYDVAIVMTDTNYYDFVRSRSDPITGRGFINRLEGGIGVFGSVETHVFRMRVVAEVDEPEEGVYRVQGSIVGRPVDVELELYLDDVEDGPFAAFLRGTWNGIAVDGSLTGGFGFGTAPDEFTAGFATTGGDADPTRWFLMGRRPALGTSFQVDVLGYRPTNDPTEPPVNATLTAVQVSGPAR